MVEQNVLPGRPVNPAVLTVRVVGSRRVSPDVIRVTLGGEELARFTPLGFDQWVRLFLPRAGQDALRLPTRASSLWYAQYLATPKPRRPHVRNYTVRAFRPDPPELDIDFIIHIGPDGTSGPATSFALAAQPGDGLGLLDQGLGFDPRPHDWTLLVADETGLPAVAGICASLPDGASGLALVELPTGADAQDFPVPAGVQLRWLPRDEAPTAAEVPGQLALATLRAATLPANLYAYVIGEAQLATGARRHLVADRGVAKAQVGFVGYWRHGHAYM